MNKTHTTNYKDTFIEIAEDSTTAKGEILPAKGGSKTVAGMQFEMVANHPYTYTSDDVLFQVYAERKDIPESEIKAVREQFFSKGQPCLRASPLTKSYVWGVHSDKDGKIAIYGRESEAYEKFSQDKSLMVVKAMKSKR